MWLPHCEWHSIIITSDYRKAAFLLIDLPLIDAQKIVIKLLQVRGLHNYNYEDFANAVSFIEDNYTKYPFGDLVEKEYSLKEVDAAFAYASQKKPVRVGIKVAD